MTLINAPGLPDFRLYFANIYAFRHCHYLYHCRYHCQSVSLSLSLSSSSFSLSLSLSLSLSFSLSSSSLSPSSSSLSSPSSSWSLSLSINLLLSYRYRRCHCHLNKHLFQSSLMIRRSSSKPKEYLAQMSSRHLLSRSVYVDSGLDYMILIISGWVRPIAWELLIVHRSHFLLYLDCINEVTCTHIRSVIKDFGTEFV